jgi:hypothetical protein
MGPELASRGFQAMPMGDNLSAIVLGSTPSPRRRQDQLDELAKTLSHRAGRCLVVEYDSRTGTRSSKLFENGDHILDFGEEDEIYAPLDRHGQPKTDGLRLRLAELDPAEEYETIQNAIELGMAKLGVCAWKELKTIIAQL